MYKAVIFDLDGLLIDTEIISWQIYNDLLCEYGYSMNINEYAQIYSGKPEIINSSRIVKEYNLPLSVDSFIDNVSRKENEYYTNKGVNLKEGALDLIEYLVANNYKLAIATSSIKEKVNKVLKPYDILKYFDVIICANDIKLGKPNPEIYLKAQIALKQAKEEILILEDSEAGIEAGYNASIDVCCIPDMKIPDSYHLKQAKYTVNNLKEVVKILAK